MEYKIQLLSPKDLAGALHPFEQSPDCFIPHELNLIETDLQSSLETGQGVNCFVAKSERDGQVIGTAIFGPDRYNPRAVDLRWMAVAGEYQGNGVGTGLVDKIVEQTARIGAHLILVHTTEDKIPFYERLGFNQVGQVPYYWGNDKDDSLILFSRQLIRA